PRIGRYFDALGGWLAARLHLVELRLRREKIDQLFDKLIQIDRLSLDFQLSSVTQKIIENVAKPRGLTMDEIEPIHDSAVRGIVRRQIFLKQLQVQLNGRERILDLVRKPTGQRAKLRESLGLPRAALGAEHATIQRHRAGARRR